MTIPDPKLVMLARATAAIHGLNGVLVCAICEHESVWDTWAFKPEPAFEKRYVDALHLGDLETWGRSQSWGLMQVMGETARELGFSGKYLSQLCDPATGLEYGCLKLAKCPGDVRIALLKYNGGRNLKYPDLVIPLMNKYRTAQPKEVTKI